MRVAPSAMLAFDLSRRMIEKGVTVLRMTSIDKLTDLELHLSVPRLMQLPEQPALASTNLYHFTTLISRLRGAPAPFSKL